MEQKFTYYLKRFLVWRAKHISEKRFILILSGVIGFTSGIGAVLLKNLTHFIQWLLEGKIVEDVHNAFYFVFPLIGFVLAFAVMKYVIKHKISHGIPTTLHSISKEKGKLKRYQMFGSILTAPLTVGFGGSVGLEGPTVSTGAAISSNIAQMLHLNQKNRNLLIGAAAAGALSSIFKAPIAAIIFAVEVFSLDLTVVSMLPLLIASVSAILTSYLFFGSQTILPFEITQGFTAKHLPFYLLLGAATGLVSIYFTFIYERIQNLFEKLKSSKLKLIVGGISLGAILFLFPSLYGEGFEVINQLLEGNYNLDLFSTLDWFSDSAYGLLLLLLIVGLLKIVATSISFGAGGVGGIFAPTLFMGAVFGHLVAKIIHMTGLSTSVSTSNFTLLGMSGLMAGVLHAPLTAIFLIAEVTGGYELFIPLMITSAMGYAITKMVMPHSVYTMELGRKGDLITHDKDHAVLTLMDIDSVIETNFIPVHPTMNLGEIIHSAVVKSKRNIFPVIDPDNKQFLGVILLDDIRSKMFKPELYNEIFVAEIMHSAPDLIDLEKDKMTYIMDKFERSGAWNLPVVKNGEYQGFISKSKLLTAYRRKLIHFTR
ncbi:MAG: chloride channel protein [Flavobacteriaceae bacterium]|jgi:CIC family chloride channel protein|nr:chloride channel protein [Flavobacteriaceae bacterium]NVJ71935.1 chloride channel protein [Flavobacteriaceae bacterium]